MKYRIKELNNRFTVQGFGSNLVCGRLRIYKPKEKWTTLDCFGEIPNNWNIDRPDSPLAEFGSQEKAKKAIKLFKNPPKPKYHYDKESDFDFLESPEYIKKKNEAASNDLKKHKKNKKIENILEQYKNNAEFNKSNEEICSKFKNGIERNKKYKLFNKVIRMIEGGVDLFEIIDSLIEINERTNKTLELIIESMSNLDISFYKELDNIDGLDRDFIKKMINKERANLGFREYDNSHDVGYTYKLIVKDMEFTTTGIYNYLWAQHKDFISQKLISKKLTKEVLDNAIKTIVTAKDFGLIN